MVRHGGVSRVFGSRRLEANVDLTDDSTASKQTPVAVGQFWTDEKIDESKQDD